MPDSGTIFAKDFYVATATVIPLLWLTVGLATGVLSAPLRVLRASKTAFNALARRVPSIRWFIWPMGLPPALLPLMFVGVGFLTELLALIALYSQSKAVWLKGSVLSGSIIVLLLSSAVLIVAIMLAQGWKEDEIVRTLTLGSKAFSAIDDVSASLKRLVLTKGAGRPYGVTIGAAARAALNNLRDAIDTLTEVAANPQHVLDDVLGSEVRRTLSSFGNKFARLDEEYANVDLDSLLNEDRHAVTAMLEATRRYRQAIDKLTPGAQAG